MPPATPYPHRLRSAAGVLGIAIVTIVLAGLSTQGLIFAGLAVAVGLAIIVLSIFGAERVGFGLLCVGFALAALSKGKIAAPIGPSLTLSDLSMFFGFILMVPRIARGRNHVSAIYAAGMLLILTTGFLASATNPAVTSSLKTLIGMLWCMTVIPFAIAAIRPSNRMIVALAWSFILGHMASVLDAFATTPLSARAYGLTAQTNEYAESGLIAIALSLYLIGRTQRRWPIYVVMALSLVSIYTSGSRGALVSLAAVLVAVPIVERTAVAGTLFTMGAAVAAVFIPIASQSAGKESALSRLFGNGTASASDNLRNQGLSNGWQQFLQHPISGSGLSNLGLIHSNLLEIAVGLGVFGFAGFVLVVISLLRPIFGSGAHRRLSYCVVAFVVFSATAPALTDRAMWVALSLGFVFYRGFTNEVYAEEDATEAEASLPAEQHELVVHADHLPQLG